MDYGEAMIEAGRQEKVQEMKSVKMDIATSINTLMDSDNSQLILKIHELIAYGFSVLEGEEDWGEPDGWTKYNSMETQRKLREELNSIAQ